VIGCPSEDAISTILDSSALCRPSKPSVDFRDSLKVMTVRYRIAGVVGRFATIGSWVSFGSDDVEGSCSRES
jgi:hypothetical protein